MKMNRHHAVIIDHIKNVYGIDLAHLSTPLRLRMISVDVSDLNELSVNCIYNTAVLYKKVIVEPNGYKKLAVSLA